ncbi:MAG: hypothetical protein HOP29_10020, partial [Phycisphaerales bacterium]|nr:hypothetical protein [Phycisphaerales bacterium]
MAVIIGSVWPAAAADPKPDHVFDDGVPVYFLNQRDGSKAIVEDDPDGFFDHLTLLDIAIRTGKDPKSDDLDAERARFKKFVAGHVRKWTRTEKEVLLAVVTSAHEMCGKSLPAMRPQAWRFIKTSGEEEGSPYTRGSAIVLPEDQLAAGVNLDIVLHEWFHVYSRLHPDVRRELYALLGFRPLPAVNVPATLQRKRITNPDGIDIALAIAVTAPDGRKIDVVPVIYSKFDQRRDDVSGTFAYLTFGLFEVRESGGSWSIVTDAAGQPSAPLSPTVDGFFQQIGNNTQYVIHPDEILADNVALLIASENGAATRPIQSVPRPRTFSRRSRTRVAVIHTGRRAASQAGTRRASARARHTGRVPRPQARG